MKPPSPNGQNGRDAGGRFAKGNSGGPGNPFARRVSRLRSLIVQELTDSDLQDIVRKMIADAKAGNAAAGKLLLNYAIGKPTDPVCEPDHVQAHELNTATATLDAQHQRQLAKPSEMDRLLAGL